MPYALFLDLNSFFAACEQQRRPELRGRPVIVVPTTVGEADGTCAIAASVEAKNYGIRTGTAVTAAKEMCPGLEVVAATPGLYSRYHERIMGELGNHLKLEEIVSIDEAWGYLSASCDTPAKAKAFAQTVKRGIAGAVGEQLTCSVGIAPNRFLAKLASDMQKPDGLVIIRKEDLPGAIAHLPLSALYGVGPRMRHRLYACGIYTMQQLWEISPGHMRRIWGGVPGARFWDALHGNPTPKFASQKTVIGHSRVLEPELRNFVRARETGRQLVMKAAVRLRRDKYLARAFSANVLLTSGRELEKGCRIPPACDNMSFLKQFDAIWELFGQYVHGNEQPKKVSVTLHELQPLQGSTPDLLGDWLGGEPQRVQKLEKLDEVIDRMNLRWGRGTVQLGAPYDWGSAPKPGTKIAFTRIPDPVEFHERRG